MTPRKLAFAVYRVLRNTARASGQMGLIRRLGGPFVGRLLYKISPGGTGPVQLHGHSMYLASSGSFPPLDMAMARYEPGTTMLFSEIIKPGMVVVDVGAHVGYFTLLAANKVGPTGKIYAFEPDQNNHALLLKNIEMNGYDNVVATQMAVSNRKGTSVLYLTALDSGRHSMYHHGLPERGSIAIETTTLDSFFSSEGSDRADLIKVDVEGAEVSVLDGMTSLIEEWADLKLIIEFNPALLQGSGGTPLTFLEKLVSQNWEIQIIEETIGLSPLGKGDDAQALTDRLLDSGTSVNLFCTRP